MERRIVFIGRTGSGKSATGNNILNANHFKTTACASSVTKKCQRGTASRNGRNFEIIETPGFVDTKMTKEDVTKEIIKCIGLTAPGPHVFVLVVGKDRFTEEEQKTVTYFQKLFGEGMLKHLIILFTRKDDLQHEDKTLEMYLQEVPEELTDLVKACRNRCIAFNNRGTNDERAQDVEHFLDLVDAVVLENGGRCYTNEMFKKAEKILREKEEQLRRELEQENQRQLTAIREQFELELQKQYDEQSEVIKQLEEKVKGLEEEKLVAKQLKQEDVMRALTKELSELKLVINDSRIENAKKEEILHQEWRNAEGRTIKDLEEKLAALREEVRRNINEESDRLFKHLWTIISSIIPFVWKLFTKA